MVTHIASHNDKLYDALFADITESISSVTVRTLEEYFMNLEAIASYVVGTSPDNRHPDKTYFLRLPVDENMVIIDANSRNIILSDAYRKNGIAVVGDTYAETLWFQIDRYYDLQDLSLTDIFIFWELPNKVKGYSQPAFKDIHSEGGKLTFSWTIPELLTETAGNIKFYVSFQTTTQAGETLYTFNTLSQNAKINATLDARLDGTLSDDGVNQANIISRLHNTTDVGTIMVARPLISSCTSSADVALFTGAGDTKNIDVYAYSIDNAAVLSYTLYKNGENTRLTSIDCFKLTEDTEVNSHKVYYNETNEVLNSVELTNPKASAAREKGKRFVVSTVGSYQCKVTATITIGSGEDAIRNTSAPAYTHRWVWEEPTEFQIKEGAVAFQDNKDGIITNSAENNKTIDIVWPKDDKESPQQKSALYSAYITIDAVNGGTAIAAATVTSDNAVNGVSAHVIGNPFINSNNLVVGTSTVRVAFTKTLNKITIPTTIEERPVLTLPIQSEAEAYPSDSIKFNGSVNGPYIQEGSKISITFTTADFNNAQTYYRTWQRLSGGKWTDIGNQIKIENTANANFEQSFNKSGAYRLKLIAKFGKSSKETVSDALITVFNVSD